MSFGVVIPARYGSERLPGKPLCLLAGKPLIVHVLENARRTGAAFVVVATDDARIAEVVTAAGAEAMLTSPEHASGTDRVAEVAARRGLAPDTVLVNVQGDEPLLDPELPGLVAAALERHPEAGIATLATPIRSPREAFDPNVVKVVVARSGLASYFSRAPIPWHRDAFGDAARPPATLGDEAPFLRHVGLYAYRAGTLQTLTRSGPAPIELAERLEQLRALWLGIAIHVTTIDAAPAHGVDTAQDLERVEAILAGRS